MTSNGRCNSHDFQQTPRMVEIPLANWLLEASAAAIVDHQEHRYQQIAGTAGGTAPRRTSSSSHQQQDGKEGKKCKYSEFPSTTIGIAEQQRSKMEEVLDILDQVLQLCEEGL